MKAFIESQFNHYPLIWIFHWETMKNKINRIHESALRLIYFDHVSSFSELLATEIYKFFHGLSVSIMKNVLHLNPNIPYNLRARSERSRRNPKTVKYRTEAVSYFAPKVWSLAPEAIKSSKSLDAFKSKIRQWEPDSPCRLWPCIEWTWKIHRYSFLHRSRTNI